MPKVVESLAVLAALVAGCGGNCPPANGADAVTARNADAGSTDTAERAEKLAEQACACPTAFCAESRSGELTALLRDRAADTTGDPATRVLIATTRVMSCRDRLSYPSEPVDMDGSLGEPASGSDSDSGSGSGSDSGSGGSG